MRGPVVNAASEGLSPQMKQYREVLVMALRTREVPGTRIGEIVAEVESHVAETGEDPNLAFGPPQKYAEQFDGLGTSFGVRGVLAALLGGAAGLALAEGVSELRDGGAFYGTSVPGWVGILLGIALAALIVPVVPRRRRERVIDPRTGQEIQAWPRWIFPLMATTFLLTLAGLWWLG